MDNKSNRINECATIVDAAKFVETHKSFIENNKGKKFIIPYIERLELYLKIVAKR